ncbi:MAG: murein biosynthesis integral membrane protein MurJ [Phycisphaeraceae bacterium]
MTAQIRNPKSEIRNHALPSWVRPTLVVYWLALVVATHWPRLDLGLPGTVEIRPDKVLHFASFVLLTLLLVHARLAGRHARPLTNLLAGSGIALAYAVVDEYTQQWFARHSSLADFLANFAAVAAVFCAQGVEALGWHGQSVRTWVCRLALAAVLPVCAVLAFARGVQLQTIILADMPNLGLSLRADKAAHFLFAGVLTILLYNAAPLGVNRRRANALFTLVLLAAASPVIEFLQTLAHRALEVDDMIAHWAGMLAVVIIWTFYRVTIYFMPEHPPAFAGATPGDESRPSEKTRMAGLGDKAKGVEQPRHAGFVGAAIVVSVLTFVSRITGLVRDAYLAAAFGLSAIADAFWFGFAMPNLSRRLFGEGALTAAFIPVYTNLLERDRDVARRFVSLCIVLIVVVLGALTVLGEWLLWSILHGSSFRGWSPDSVLAIHLTMIMLPYMPLICLVALFGAVLQVHGRFAPAAGMPVLLNVVMIVGTFWAVGGLEADEALRRGVYLVGLTVILAGVVQLLTQLVAMLRYEKLTLVFTGTGPAFAVFWRNFMPTFLALSVFQVNTFLDQMIAMGLSPKAGSAEKLHILGRWVDYPIEQGGLAALNCAQRLYQFPLGVFGLAIATAIFPALARAASAPAGDGDLHTGDRFRTILRQGLRLTVFIGLPASVGLILVGMPLSRVIFERGAFTLEDSRRVTWILLGYAPAIWAYSMTHVLTRGFYALRDSRTPMIVSLLMVMLNLALNLTLVWPLGAAGLAWSTAICAILQCGLMVAAMRNYVDKPIDKSVLISWGRTALLSVLMALALAPIIIAYNPSQLTKLQNLAELAVMLAVGLLIALGGAWVLGSEEIGWLRRRRKVAAEEHG